MLRFPRRADRARPGCAPVRFGPEALEARTLLATVAWDGQGLDGDWHNPLNWAGDVLPTAEDDVVIEPDATPDVVIAAGRTVSIRSLELGKGLTIGGTLDVAEFAEIGAVGLGILEGGAVRTPNLTLAAGPESAVNAGAWTVGGDSIIARAIENTGTLVIAGGAHVTLSEGGESQGRLLALAGGLVEIGDRAEVTAPGAGLSAPEAEAHLWAGPAGRITFGSLAMITGAHIGTEGGVGDAARLQFSGTTTTILMECLLALDDAVVTGNADGAGTDLRLVDADSVVLGHLRLDGGQVDVRGFLRTWLGPASVDGVVEIFNGELALGDAGGLSGDIRIVNSTITLSGAALIGGGRVELEGTTIGGAGELAMWSDRPAVAESLHLIGCTIEAGAGIRANENTLHIEGDGATMVRGFIAVEWFDRFYGEPRMEWTGGGLVLEGESALLSIGKNARLTITAGGPLEGDGTFLVARGGEVRIQDVDEFVIACRLDMQGTLLVADGDLHLTGAVANLIVGDAASRPETPWGFGLAETVRLAGGTWHAFGEGRILFARRIDWNAAKIVLENDGAMPDLGHKTAGGQLVNSGRIVLRSVINRGLLGTGYSTRIANTGWIMVERDTFATLLGDVVNLKGGDVRIDGGKLVVRGDVVNRGRIDMGSINGGVLLVRKDYTQVSRAVLTVGAGRNGSVVETSRIRVLGTMSLNGKLRVHGGSQAWTPGPVGWRAGDAGGGRTGEFNRVEFHFLYNLAGELAYLPRGFEVVLSGA